MTGSIICGVDGSKSAWGAARVARRLSAQLGFRLVFVRVVEEGADERELREVSSRLRNLAERATDVRAEWIVEVGHPADRLVAVARREGASFVVVGSTGPHASLLGSISADVSRRAPCPVVVVGLGSDAAFGEEPGGGGVSERHPFPRPKERRTNGGPDRRSSPSIIRLGIDGGTAYA
jgi:nucleotide-binding universal stress UspA family protein